MTTTANVRKSDGSRFYTRQGEAVYEIPKKSGKGMKKPTIVDARENGWLPSVTTILKILNKPGLNDWITEQAVLAVLSTPRKEGEKDDEFVKRVLQDEKIQDEEARIAADRGTAIHNAIECAINGEEFDEQWKPYVNSALDQVEFMGKIAWSEKVLIGEGYAGRADLLVESSNRLVLVDFKTAKTLPSSDGWAEHKLQLSAYAKAIGNTGDKRLVTCLLYLSTVNPGQVAPFFYDDWDDMFLNGFTPALKLWQYLNDYTPNA